jgi:uncharacterized membrane protein YkvA (DUF1232 family)
LENIKKLGKRIKKEIRIYQLVLKDKKTPLLPKILLWITVAYALSPIDLIPDFIPVIGYLDDALILPLLFFISLKFIPKEIIGKHRKRLDNLTSKKD